jgi:hypothetical protein
MPRVADSPNLSLRNRNLCALQKFWVPLERILIFVTFAKFSRRLLALSNLYIMSVQNESSPAGRIFHGITYAFKFFFENVEKIGGGA